jgi:hypothetical protein
MPNMTWAQLQEDAVAGDNSNNGGGFVFIADPNTLSTVREVSILQHDATIQVLRTKTCCAPLTWNDEVAALNNGSRLFIKNGDTIMGAFISDGPSVNDDNGPFGKRFPVQLKFHVPTAVGTCDATGVQHKIISETKVQLLLNAMRDDPASPSTNPKRANAWTTTTPNKPHKSTTPRTPLKSVNTSTSPSSASKATNDKILLENAALSAKVEKLSLQVASLKSLIEQISIKAIEITEIASMEDIH